MSKKLTVVAFNSAYPGSMSPREEGDYIERTDATSLAGALLEQIAGLTRQVEDLTAVVESPLVKAAPDLLEACQRLMVCMKLAGWEGDDSAHFARAAIAKAMS
jgi:hypothetical protein